MKNRILPLSSKTPSHHVFLALKTLMKILACCALSGNANARQSDDIPATQALSVMPFSTLDRNFVDVASGAVNLTLEDVAIGHGELSLSHTIGTQTSDFINYETYWGPMDKFHGGLVMKRMRSQGITGYHDDLHVLQYVDFEGSLDFEINGNGTYTPLNDSLSSLEYHTNQYIVTKANGTRVEIPTNGAAAITSNQYSGTTYNYNKIIYPNGYTINVVRQGVGLRAKIHSVTTNTGLQLKYHYNPQSRPLSPALDAIVTLPGANMDNDGLNWSTQHPESVTAINRGDYYCADTGSCSLAGWPGATYDWPAGMPKAAYVADSVFSVTDSAGRVTEYHHSPFDINEGPSEYYTARLSSVKFAHETTASISWEYENVLDSSPSFSMFGTFRKNIGPGTIVRATNKGRQFTYSVGANGNQFTINQNTWQTSASGHKAVERYAVDTYNGVPLQIDLWDKNIFFTQNTIPNTSRLGPIYNRVERIEHKRGKGSHRYEYDGQGHLIRVWQDSASGGSLMWEADYPDTCSETEFRICHQPTWTQDARGNRTDYSYHEDSGQPATITYPADEQGIRPEVRYTYEQKHAWYKNSSGTIVKEPTGVWLLTTEKTCRIGNTRTDDSACDTTTAEIVTTYHYGTGSALSANNLWLKGITVTADGESRTTCYGYNKLGQRISETAPKSGNLTCS